MDFIDLVNVYAERGTSPVVDEFAQIVGDLIMLAGQP
jgi:hypothetical protein